MTAGIVILFLGYTVGSYGVVLLRGYDVPFRQWINPLTPYVWPAGKVPQTPADQLFPSR